jgi:hypothetical protein
MCYELYLPSFVFRLTTTSDLFALGSSLPARPPEVHPHRRRLQRQRWIYCDVSVTDLCLQFADGELESGFTPSLVYDPNRKPPIVTRTSAFSTLVSVVRRISTSQTCNFTHLPPPPLVISRLDPPLLHRDLAPSDHPRKLPPRPLPLRPGWEVFVPRLQVDRLTGFRSVQVNRDRSRSRVFVDDVEDVLQEGGSDALALSGGFYAERSEQPGLSPQWSEGES